MTRMPNLMIWAEMARRKKQFHADKDWDKIWLWGLFDWSAVSYLLEDGRLVTHMCQENRTIWVRPSAEAYHKHIEPLLDKSLDELLTLAGWV